MQYLLQNCVNLFCWMLICGVHLSYNYKPKKQHTMKTNLKLTKVTTAQVIEMYNNAFDVDRDFIKRKVERLSAFADLQMYVIPSDEHFSYPRFFASYMLNDGLKLFGAIDNGLTNAGLVKITIDDELNVHKHNFKDQNGNEGRIENNESNRMYCAKLGIMVSNSI